MDLKHKIGESGPLVRFLQRDIYNSSKHFRKKASGLRGKSRLPSPTYSVLFFDQSNCKGEIFDRHAVMFRAILKVKILTDFKILCRE